MAEVAASPPPVPLGKSMELTPLNHRDAPHTAWEQASSASVGSDVDPATASAPSSPDSAAPPTIPPPRTTTRADDPSAAAAAATVAVTAALGPVGGLHVDVPRQAPVFGMKLKPPALRVLSSPGAPTSPGTPSSRVVRKASMGSEEDSKAPPRLHSTTRATAWDPADGSAAAVLAEVATAVQHVQTLHAELQAREAALSAQWRALEDARAESAREASQAQQRLQQARAHNTVLQRSCDDYRRRLNAANRDLTIVRRDNTSLRAMEASVERVTPDDDMLEDLLGVSTAVPAVRRDRRLPSFGTTPETKPTLMELYTPGKVVPPNQVSRTEQMAYARHVRRQTNDSVDELAQQYAAVKLHNGQLQRELATLREVTARQGQELTMLKLHDRQVPPSQPGTSAPKLPSFGGAAAWNRSLPLSPDRAQDSPTTFARSRPRQSESLYVPSPTRRNTSPTDFEYKPLTDGEDVEESGRCCVLC